MPSKNIARSLVLLGVSFVGVLVVAFSPVVLMIIIWEVSAIHSHVMASLGRVGCVIALLLTGVVAWRRENVMLAAMFLFFLLLGVGIIAIINWSWVFGAR